MPKTILIAPLGKIPHTVTTLIHALQRDGHSLPDEVYTLSTRGVSKTGKIVKLYLQKTFQIDDYHNHEITADDICTEDDTDSFRRKLDEIMQKLEADQADLDDDEKAHIIVSVVGGRKTMSALVAVTAQQHRIHELYDLWVHEAAEANFSSSLELDNVLNDLIANRPVQLKPSDENHYRLINLPILPLVNLRQTIDALDTLSLEGSITVNVDLSNRRDLILSGIPGRLTLEQAEAFITMQESLIADPDNEHRRKALREFLKSSLDIDYPSADWRDHLRNPKSYTPDEFAANILPPLQTVLDSTAGSGIFDLKNDWDATQSGIIPQHGNPADPILYLVSLLRHSLKVGYRFEPLSPQQQAGLRGKGIFLCYPRVSKSDAQKLVKDLNRIGVYPWWDTDIIGGEAWEAKIHKAMNDSQICLLLLTSHSFDSPFILNTEIPHFRGASPPKIIIPLRFDSTVNPRRMETLQLQHLQYLVFDGRYGEAFHELRTALIQYAG